MDPLLTLASAIAAILALITLGYAGLCWVIPFTTCKRCAGTGHTTTRILHRPRACRRCDRGMRLRLGRRVYNVLHRLRAEAHR
ncbi:MULTISPECIES: hypothetical protein [unclassified Micromonospora]|uniref:hypothetical protein n=1 Tax=unclassified Micromonospora TaxID=2617518 RepID=UPI0003EEC3D5|nr:MULTISPECIES: hypothetical protein [unclassified Micromonospora]EWM64341.1 hypothetical protein MCBG_01474 [Micromonospora sp. M42]MCK1810215.1 hypothetical protein [Micromonospora sp. R42106]MCK1835528.1 hypothetical protein [Micromonospora sp. R42003]MCK1847459.1 hypothetical protein [Micromonospora sp. R42004]MCM1015312.1 hypothetical protein [Micromonospora sp. XM-20-01]